GAVYTFGAEVVCTDCTFSDNTAGDGGGAFFKYNPGNFAFTNCTFARNTTASTTNNGGGAIGFGGDVTGGTRTPTHCRLLANSTPRLGGAVRLMSTDATLTGCTFSGNSANGTTSGGGGIAASAGSQVALTNCLFTENHSDEARPGGAIWVGDGLAAPSTA